MVELCRPTGLASGNKDVEEPAGCPSTSNNFLAPIEALADDQYMLMINDFSKIEYGFTLRFIGTAVLSCITGIADPELAKPQATFAVYPTVSTGTIFILMAGAGLSENHLNVFNAEGQLVYSNEQLSGTASQVDQHHLPPGAYIAALRTTNSTQTPRFLITK